MHIVNEGRLELYEDEEEFIVCYRLIQNIIISIHNSTLFIDKINKICQ